jgi:hypothetical protein
MDFEKQSEACGTSDSKIQESSKLKLGFCLLSTLCATINFPFPFQPIDHLFFASSSVSCDLSMIE